VDDAHGIGVLGGRAAVPWMRPGWAASEVPILMGTLGKALGTAGAFVAGSEDLIETLIQAGRPACTRAGRGPVAGGVDAPLRAGG
jgi:8-amino-7-oxononanoate synthase